MTDLLETSPPLIDQQLCFALYSTSRAITKVYAGLLEELNLTYPQYLTMLVLWESDGLSVQEIADRLHLEGATVTPLVKRIENMGLIHKKRSTSDERRLEVHLTEKGAALQSVASKVPERLGCALNLSNEKAHRLLIEITALRESIT